jgi:hypothetical protein
MFWESFHLGTATFPWINLAFYRPGGRLCKNRSDPSSEPALAARDGTPRSRLEKAGPAPATSRALFIRPLTKLHTPHAGLSLRQG